MADSAEHTDSTVAVKVVTDPVTGETMSKRKLRKLQKTRKWEENKHIKRQGERERKKARRRRLLESGADLGPSRKTLKRNKMADSSCQVKVVVDCSFDDYMSEKDVGDIVKQLSHSYAANRRADNPVQFYVTSVEKKMKVKLDSQDDTKYWDIHLSSQHYEELFPKQNIVYLSSDSNNVLTELTDDKVYVIGGLVDHNHYKGLCHRIAEERGLTHAKLPIDEYIRLHARKVLSVNQVFEILVRYTETGNWETAFLTALPKRKGAQAKCTDTHALQESSPSASHGVDTSTQKSSAEPCMSKDTEMESSSDSIGKNSSAQKNSSSKHVSKDTEMESSSEVLNAAPVSSTQKNSPLSESIDTQSNGNVINDNEAYCTHSETQKNSSGSEDIIIKSSSNVVSPDKDITEEKSSDIVKTVRESSSSDS